MLCVIKNSMEGYAEGPYVVVLVESVLEVALVEDVALRVLDKEEDACGTAGAGGSISCVGFGETLG